MAAGIEGGTPLVFSITTGSGPLESYGIVQSANISVSTQRAEVAGPDGNVVSVQEYDIRKELSMNYVELATSIGGPVVGTTFSYEGETWYINSIDTGETVQGHRTVDVSATNFPNLSV